MDETEKTLDDDVVVNYNATSMTLFWNKLMKMFRVVYSSAYIRYVHDRLFCRIMLFLRYYGYGIFRNENISRCEKEENQTLVVDITYLYLIFMTSEWPMECSSGR